MPFSIIAPAASRNGRTRARSIWDIPTLVLNVA